MSDVIPSLIEKKQEVIRLAEARLTNGESADEFIKLAHVGEAGVYLAASKDMSGQNGSPLHANSADCLLYLIEGSMTIAHGDGRSPIEVPRGGMLRVPAGVVHSAHFQELAVYLAVVDEKERIGRVLSIITGPAGEEIEVVHHERPGSSVRDGIARLARLLTPRWFTENVPEDVRQDLLFQQAITCNSREGIVGFLVFTGIDRALQVTLMGTDPSCQRHGIGRALLMALRDIGRTMDYRCIRALTKPPETNPDYEGTVQFYKTLGFRQAREYHDLWENGAIELEWSIDE
jgi:GNAT superfamily N-acetyltransferase